MRFARIALIGVALASAPVAAAAEEQRPVKSGEHADFTRLVFYLPEPRGWTVGRTQDGYGLRIEGDAVDWDLSRIFLFIPRTRIAEVDQSAGTVSVDVACDCHAIAFEHRPDILVLDIVDGAPDPEDRFETALVDPDDEEQPDRPAARATSYVPGLVERTFPPVAMPAPPEKPVPSVPAPDVQTMRDDLTMQLSRALSQGLLDVSAADEKELRSNATAALPPDVDQPQPAELPALPTAIPMGAETAIDRNIQAGATGADPGVCLPQSALVLASPDPKERPADVLASATSIDATDPQKALLLARSFGSLGFGAEMAGVLRGYSGGNAEAATLTQIAAILDEPYLTNDGTAAYFAGQVSCDTAGPIWAVLATGGRNLNGRINKKALLREFSRLPSDLRRHLAPALSAGLRQAGLADTAHAVRSAALRSGETQEAALVLELGQAESARAQASPPKPDASVPGLRAMVGLLDKVASGAVDGSDDLFTEAEALSHEAKGSAAGEELFAALVDALAADGRFAEAFSLVGRMRGSTHAAAYDFPAVEKSLYDRLAQIGADAEFLYFTGRLLAADQSPVLTAETRLKVGQRMAALGFTDHARTAIAPGWTQEGPARQIVAAEIALADDQPVEALARLAGLEGEQADRLRADALIQVGAGHDAAEVLQRTGDAAIAGRDAWNSAEWATAAVLLEPQPRKALAAALSGMFPGDDEAGESAGPPVTDASTGAVDREGGFLAQKRQMLDRSAEIRTMIGEMLAETVEN